MEKRLDIRGEVCPTLFVKVKAEMERLRKGEKLEVVLKERDLKDVMSALKIEGYQVLHVSQEGDAYRVTVTK
ncbi:MAG: sulfurtransferase TusA family protein [Syntrophaceae bacterium]|nr:sulfurtransferase TusA family protein [Syntrophaceae bacterium]